MDEVLYIYSPTTLILSFVGLAIALYYPYMLEYKAKISLIPKAIRQFITIMVFWNISSIVGLLFFSGSEYSVLRQIVFGIQALAWIQIGNAVHHITEITLKIRRYRFWKILNIFGAALVILATILFCLIPQKICDFEILGYHPLEEHPVFYTFSFLFLIFVVPNLTVTCYNLLKNTLQTGDKSIAQIGTYMLGAFVVANLLAAFFDFILPIATDFTPNITYLQWYQYCSVFLSILCGQYFTSITFKNKSSHWFLEQLVDNISDCVLYFDKKGFVISSNLAAQLLFEMNEDEIKTLNIKDFLNKVDPFQEGHYNNLKVQIKDELHTFNISIFHVRQTMTAFVYAAILSDQTHSLFYQQRVKAMNRQINNYKQEFLRYQNRLNLSDKKRKETENIYETLINALPFQFWSKNENGVYKTQNHADIEKRHNLTNLTDDKISDYEKDVRETGKPKDFISYENKDADVITEDQANLLIKNNEKVNIYHNHFIAITPAHPPYKIIGLKIDITEAQRNEREKNILREQKIIHSRLEELGTICGSFAHDYNNILGAQIGFCELAKETLNKLSSSFENEKLQKQTLMASNFVEEATKAARRGKESLNTLLDTVRGKASKEIKAMVFMPSMVIKDVIAKLSLTLPPNITINSENMDEHLKIRGQVPSLDRIISNLASNAIYAMKEKGGTLTFSIVREDLEKQLITPYAPLIPTGSYVKISVADTGTGMDSGTLERIFSPFFTTKAPGEGLGLGLSSAIRLLKEDKAYFTVQTTVGEGTTFNLYWILQKNENEFSEEK